MFGFGDAKDSRDEVYNGEPREGKWTHELVAGGAAFEAMKLFEDKQRKEGMFETFIFLQLEMKLRAG